MIESLQNLAASKRARSDAPVPPPSDATNPTASQAKNDDQHHRNRGIDGAEAVQTVPLEHASHGTVGIVQPPQTCFELLP